MSKIGGVTMIQCQSGDILLYRKSPTLFEQLVEDFEQFEDGRQRYQFYHCGIALDTWNTIEADGRRVNVNPIDYEKASIFRPPIQNPDINYALGKIRKFIGQRYDWMLILDDAIRYLTHNKIHLPAKYIRSTERHAKVCSTLVARYFYFAGWGAFYGFNESPEDIWLSVKDYEVY
jgi:hypothetical protein